VRRRILLRGDRPSRPTGVGQRIVLRGAVALAGIAVAACGAPAGGGPRDALRSVLDGIAAGDVAGVCRNLTPAATAELRRDFGGASCTATLTTTVSYVRVRAGEQAAVRGARILPTVDIPLSPAPYRPGSTRTSLRVAFDDPVLGEPQELDVGLRLLAGRWQVDSGIAALFTLLS
jgi:hypothetical protein